MHGFQDDHNNLGKATSVSLSCKRRLDLFDLVPHSPNGISELPRRACFRTLFLLGLATASAISPTSAQEKAAKLEVVATFSILGDFARNVGGNQVNVTALVGPNGDVHVYSPTPADAEAIRNARLVIVNGLGLEGWLPRLVDHPAAMRPPSSRPTASCRATLPPGKYSAVIMGQGRRTRTPGDPCQMRKSVSAISAMPW